MAAEIRWSANAIQDYQKVVDYLLIEWSEQIALKFIELLEHKLNQVSEHPYIGLISSKDLHIRSINITKHNRLYYRILSHEILEVASIFDTRQHPDKNIYE